MRAVEYSFYKKLTGLSIASAEQRVTEALQQEGFGVLTRIDVQATLKKKLDADFKPYVILGACNPPIAHQALTQDDMIGLLLPCNVVVSDAEGGAEVAIVRPSAMFKTVDRPDMEPIVDEAEGRLRRVIESL